MHQLSVFVSVVLGFAVAATQALAWDQVGPVPFGHIAAIRQATPDIQWQRDPGGGGLRPAWVVDGVDWDGVPVSITVIDDERNQGELQIVRLDYGVTQSDAEVCFKELEGIALRLVGAYGPFESEASGGGAEIISLGAAGRARVIASRTGLDQVARRRWARARPQYFVANAQASRAAPSGARDGLRIETFLNQGTCQVSIIRTRDGVRGAPTS
jgi:hypothetical protein